MLWPEIPCAVNFSLTIFLQGFLEFVALHLIRNGNLSNPRESLRTVWTAEIKSYTGLWESQSKCCSTQDSLQAAGNPMLFGEAVLADCPEWGTLKHALSQLRGQQPDIEESVGTHSPQNL